MNKRKWKKLSKRFACALALAMLMSVNPAWAEVEHKGDTLEITDEIVTSSEHTSLGRPDEKFDLSSTYLNVNIINENKRGIDISGEGNFNTPNTSFTVTVNGEAENCDALHVRGSNNNVYVKDFAAYVHAHNSDAINMSHDVGGDASMIVKGDLKAVVDNGNGIRANGSRNGVCTSTLTVEGDTDITLNAGRVEQSYSITPDMANRLDKDYLDGKLSQFVLGYKDNLVESLGPWGSVVSSIWDKMDGSPIDKVFYIADMEAVGLYHTAAVYAGNSASPLINEWSNDGDTKGRGIINLGTTDITLNGDGSYGVYAGKNGTINIGGDLNIKSNGTGGYGVAARGLNLIYGETNVTATATIKDNFALFLPDGYDEVTMILGGLNLDNAPNTFGSYVTLNGDENTITMRAGGKALYASGRSENSDNVHGNSNTISSGSSGIGYLKATGDVAADDGGKISLWLRDYLSVTGSVSAESGGTVEFTSDERNTVTSTAQRTTSASGEEITFTNALYADGKNSNVEITAGNGAFNEITTKTDGADESSKERTVWAANGGSVKLTGVTSITAGLTTFDGASNSARIAIAAGTDDWAKNAHKNDAGEIIFDVTDANRSHVYLNYGDAAGTASSVTGDIVSGYGGSISVARAQNASQASAMNFTGNALAANGGELSLALGDGGVWHGRADDYKDAESEEWRKAHTDIFAPQFSNDIQSNGFVNVNLGSGSIWNVTGQSWVSKLEGDGHIYLNGEETGGYAVHIGELTGSNTFYLNLYNGDKIGDGDMIYIAKEVSAPQKIEIVNRDTVLSSMKAGDRIRFATIGGEVGFSEGAASTQPAAAFGRSTRIKDAGMLNVDFSIDYLDYNHADNDDENHDAYHGGSEMSAKKPGAEYVDSIYRANENSQNVYITRLESTENPTEEPKLSDAGRTVLNMSRANYAAAVYMDRLNKRMGEARYFAGQDEGIWARIRHDRVGRDDAFLVQNTMFEVGYDRKIASKTGTRRVGIAADYMEGDTEYNNIAGEGEIDRFGLWLYSTWLGDKGHYTDYVLKWGRMSNEFDIYGMTTGERITGDYDNNVFSASAEYGRRIELGKGWFFEPQAQVQFARITDADYVTSQGTRVEVDGVNSLIARAGFRLGREFGGDSQGSVYVKADVLHEFLGDQDVHALDGTTDNRWYTVGYDNDGTWYDVGLGLSCRTGKNSFVFLDLEHSFGNDNDDSYQISAGVQWSF